MPTSEEINCRKCGSKLQMGFMKVGSHEMPVLNCPDCGSRYATRKDAMAIEKKIKKR